MKHIVKHESQYNRYAVGDSGNSIGLVQIFLKWHPEVTREDAEDIDFALDFLGKNLAEGRCYLWSTCPIENRPSAAS